MDIRIDETKHIEKICAQIDLPVQPRLGSIGKWSFFVGCILAAIWGATRTGMRFTPEQTKWNLVFLLPFLILALITLCDIVFGYIGKKREYEFSRKNEKEYRIQKAIEFLNENQKEKEYAELIRDFYTEYPGMRERMERKQKYGNFFVRIYWY